LDARGAARRRGRGEPHRVQRDLEAGLGALRQGSVRHVHRRLREARVDLGRPRERLGGLAQVVLAEDRANVLDRDHGVLALGEVREPSAIPRVRPVGFELSGPFELPRRVVVVRFVVRNLTQAVGDEAQPQVDQRIVAIPLRHLDRRGLEALQR